jgi:class 3 adenylate cyclase
MMSLLGNGESGGPVRPLLFGLSALGARVLSGMMIAVMLLVILAFVAPVVEDAQSFSYIRSALAAERAIESTVKTWIPTRIAGKDMTRWIILAGMFILSGVISRAGERLHNRASYLKYKANLDIWKSQMNLSDNAIILSPLNRKLEALKTARRKDREELLRDFAETKKRLDEMGKDLAFLSIDVVDSTGLKMAEERAAVEHDFKEYKRFVEGKLSSSGCLKATWTPDGVMSCFTTVDAAVRAARDVINGLDSFNGNVKTIRGNFRVRCGVNAGFVYFDETLPLEEVSDRVIDIAAHIQKKAKPNTVSVAKPAIEPLAERSGFEPAGTVVDGYEVYEWRTP